ncbi:MAG: formylglycine-generating enzyme family protein, partial [Chloroflexota bacterium]
VWVRRELDYGAAQGKRIFPAMIRGTRNDAIPITIIDAQFVDLRREYDPNFARLRDALQRHLGRAPAEPKPEPVVPTTAQTPPKKAAPKPARVEPVAERGRTGLATPPDGVAIPHIVTGAPPLNIDWCWVPAGPFTMGSDVYSREKPVHTVALDGFWLARYPLTNAQYRHFVEAGGYEQQRWWTEAGWRWRQSESVKHPGYWTDSHWNGDRQPVVGVSWYEADAFARWAAETTGEPISLPTEAQWEKAARGMDGRTYPWGNDEPTDKLCNFNGNVGKTTPIGQYSPAGDGPYGNADLAGNVWEWTGSLYKPYPYDAGDGREDAAAEGFRALRGGSWLSPRANARAASRDDVSPFDRDSYYGFRLVVRCPPSK